MGAVRVPVTDRFVFSDPVLLKSIPVHLAIPEKERVRSVLFVMHGTLRNAAEYRDAWAPAARAAGALLLVPEFSKRDFPGGLYNRGNVMGLSDDAPQAREAWTFGAIERLFTEAQKRWKLTQETYDLYGHSAGGQFVHRFVLFMPEARLRRAVAANAGYYTLPTLAPTERFPFGLSNAPGTTERSLSRALSRNLTVLLGEEDTDPNDPDLYRSVEADRQGLTRLARGKNFYSVARTEAALRSCTLAWKLQTVSGVGHSNTRMAPAAARLLFSEI